MKKEENKKDVDEKKIKFKTVILSLLILTFVFFVTVSFMIYVMGSESSFLKSLERKIPFPAASVNGWNFVYIGEVRDNLVSVKRFYEVQDFSEIGVRIDFNTQEGQKKLKIKEKEIINKMIEDKAIEVLAKDRGILVTDKMVEENLMRRMEDVSGAENIKENLNKLYGWSLDDFSKKVVKPGLYKNELEKFVEEKVLKEENVPKRKKVESIKERLDSGDDFSGIAKESSEGESASRNGDLGWFKKAYLSESVGEAVFGMNVGDVSDIVESEIGYHIVRLDDKKTEEDEEMVKISQVFIAKKSFSDWLEDEMKKMHIRVFMKDYSWNEEKLISEFADENLREYEKSLLLTN